MHQSCIRLSLLITFTCLLSLTIVQSQEIAERVIQKGNATGQSADALLARALTTGYARVIVGLRVDFQPEGILDSSAVQSQRMAIAQAQNRLLGQMSAYRVSSVKQFPYISFIAMEVDAAGLQFLRSSPDITSIEEDIAVPPSLAESVPLIGAPAAWANGFSGTGQTVAILDSGVDKAHPFFTGKVVSEACYSTTNSSSTSVCPGGVPQSTATDSGVNCATSINGCDHGTHVAGIAAGKGTGFSGVARDANVISIQVFSRFSGSSFCGSSSPCVLTYTSDVLLGLQRVQTLSSSFSIAAVNLSLGGGKFNSNCDSANPAYKMTIENLRSLGIATVVASGNDGNTGSMASPACISSAISVGSTGDGTGGTTVDAVSSFSDSASFLNFLAPGELINSSIPGGGFANFRGTSMSAPHVSGAWAVLKSKTPAASVSQIAMALKDNGLSVTDPRNSITKPRIRVDASVNALSGSACTYGISPATQSFNASGGTGTVNVTAGAGCAWTASSNVPWITISSGSTGSGNATVGYSVAANTGVNREGTLFVAGHTFIVTQAGVPALAIDDGSFENFSGLAAGGNSYRVNRLAATSYPATINAVAIFFPSGTGLRVGDPLMVVAGINPSGNTNIDGIQLNSTPATVQALDQFNVYSIPALTINSGDFVVGMQISHASGVLPFAIDATPPSQRRSYRSINGTTYSLIDDIGTPGNYGIRALLTQDISCPTVASVNPSTAVPGSTITITGTDFSGVTAVRFANNVSAQFTVISNTSITTTVPDSAITGPITISRANCGDVRTAIFTVIPCVSISPTSQGFNAEGGTGSISVTSLGCNWMASSSVSWITITSGGSGSGNGTINFAVAANTSSSARTGTITLGGQTFNVRQAGVGGTCAEMTISPGQAVNGALTAGDCLATARTGYADRYSFSGTSGQQVAILLNSTIFDTYLYLIGPNGAVVASDDDSGDGSNSRIPASGFFSLPSTGTYIIETTSFGSNSTGGYTLILFSATAGCTYALTPAGRTFESSGGTENVNVTTTGSGCVWQAISQASWITINSGNTGTNSGPLTYTVAANTSSSSRAGTLFIVGQTFTVRQAGVGGSCAVTTISPGQAVNGGLAASDCPSTLRSGFADQYSFSGTSGQRIAILLNSTAFDTYLYLIGPNGAVVASDDDSGDGSNSRIPASGLFSLPSTGTYIIETTSFSSGSTGNYTLILANAVANVSAASFSGESLAAVSIVAAFGSRLATAVRRAETTPLPTELEGTTVRVTDSSGTERPAQLFFVAPGQVNFLMPTGTATGTATVTIRSGDGSVSLGTVQIATVAPGMFTANSSGQGVPAGYLLRVRGNQRIEEPISMFDPTQNRFVPRPIDLGPESDQIFVVLFGTGIRFRSMLSAASVTIGGIGHSASYAGDQGGFVGLDQINTVQLARSLAGRGEVDVVVRVDGRVANTMRIAVQ